MSKELINWRAVSKTLTTSDNSIRKNQCPKKYQSKVNELVDFVGKWQRGETESDHELLSSFFFFFRNNGERLLGLTIEQLVDEFLKQK